MTLEELKSLITQKESPKLDFKREWYKQEDLKTELIKDIIALTNGNIHTIGESSYLIIGIKENLHGNELYSVEIEVSLDDIKKQLLQNLQKYATPSIHNLEISKFTIEFKDIVVIEIPFHPYLVILKEKLRQFPKDTLLYRAGEGTVSADYATRKTFEEAVEKYNKEDTLINYSLVNSITPAIIETKIDGDFHGWDGETIFKLINGQIWQQSSYAYHYSYKFMPKVMIYKSTYGFKMKVDGDSQTLNVKQLK